MSKVTEGPGGWDFTCPAPDGVCTFTSTGWPTKKLADARGRQHLDEHETGQVMPELHDFRIANGVNPDGSLA
jgi:hypothetical protein